MLKGTVRRRSSTVALASGWAMLMFATAAPVTSQAQARPNFAEDIAPIVYAHCIVCHRPGQQAPFSLIGYDDVKAKAEEIVESTRTRRMPPWRATDERGFPALRDVARLPNRHIQTFKRWVDTGMPAGNFTRAPVPPVFQTGWTLGIPNVILTLPRRISIPADSSDRLFNIVLPMGLAADQWLTGIDFQPTTEGVLHHAVFFALPADRPVDDEDVLPGFGGLMGNGASSTMEEQLVAADLALETLGVWVPGGWPRLMPADAAQRLRRQSNIVMQLHATASDTGVIEDGRVALYFSKTPPIRRVTPILVPPSFGMVSGLDVSPGERRVLTDTLTLPVDVDVIGARGHAHLLARDLKLTAAPPGKSARGLLHIDQWDPRWHDTYYFREPVRLPKGTVIRTDITYDNSKANPRVLLNPPSRVAWGPHLSEEIGAMVLLATTARTEDAAALGAASSQHFRNLLLKNAKGR